MCLFVGLYLFPFGLCHFLVSDGDICSGAGAKVSKPGELHVAVVLLKAIQRYALTTSSHIKCESQQSLGGVQGCPYKNEIV